MAAKGAKGRGRGGDWGGAHRRRGRDRGSVQRGRASNQGTEDWLSLRLRRLKPHGSSPARRVAPGRSTASIDATQGSARGESPLRLLWLPRPRIAGSLPGGWPQKAQGVEGVAEVCVAPIGAADAFGGALGGEGFEPMRRYCPAASFDSAFGSIADRCSRGILPWVKGRDTLRASEPRCRWKGCACRGCVLPPGEGFPGYTKPPCIRLHRGRA